MIQIMLVGSVAGLKSYMTAASTTINVSHSFENLVGYRHVLESEFITIDKLIYVYQDKNLDFRKDMSFFKGLLNKMNRGEGFFTCDEIIFFCNTDIDPTAVKTFETTMEVTNFTNYKIKTSHDNFAFTDIYKYMLNISSNDLAPTKHVRIVRVRGDSPVKEVYEPETDRSTEAFINYDLDNTKRYRKAKKDAARAETGTIFKDEIHKDVINEKFDNPKIDIPEINNPFSRTRKICIFCGEPKSGVSTNVAYTRCSAVEGDKTVTIINMTNKEDTVSYIRYLEYGYLNTTLRNFMMRPKLEHRHPINIINITKDIRLEGLYYVLDNLDKIDSDVIFIEIPKDLLSKVVHSVGINIDRVFYSVENTEKDITSVFNFINYLSEDFKVIIILAQILNVLNGMVKRTDVMRVNTMFSDRVKLVAPIEYNGVNTTIYKSLTEV